jgi:uncharacterized protein YqgQ
MANPLFYYFGDDEAYFKTLQSEFKNSTKMQMDFKRIFESDEKKIQTLFIKVFQNKPVCVFIDFSKHSQAYLHLARILCRTPLEHKLVTVGLVDNLSSAEVLIESIATGVNLTHVKGPECYDVVFSATKLVAPNEIGEHAFAKASMKEDWEAGIPVKVGYVKGDGLHFETNQNLERNSHIRLQHSWIKSKIVPSQEMVIRKSSSTNLFYQFKYGVDADFLFVDEFLPPDGMEEARINEKKQEREDLIHIRQKQLARWIDDNASRSLEKKAKVLVVDRDFHFYNDQMCTDKHPYTIRCIPYFDDIGMELDRLEPQVIAFALEKDEAVDPKNTNEKLIKLLEAVKNKIQDTSPIVIVFNCKNNSKKLQDSFSYAHIMASESELSVDVLVRIADVFEKKLALLIPAVGVKEDQKVFLKKTNAASIAEIITKIKVIKLSETDMILTSDVPLEIGMNLHLTNPVDMFINIQPTKNQGKVPEYQGLIHCMGEAEKKELRRYVNAVFFRDHDAQVNAETDEFKKLNEAKLLEKEELLKAQEASDPKKETA